MEDLVSIITPTHNSAKYILETYNSIKNQTYRNWEWIIIDDCSKDDTVELINNKILKDKRVKLIVNEKNVKAAASRNKGIKQSKGKYITFIDSDDLWKKFFLEKQLKLIKKKECGLVYSSYERKNIDLIKSLGEYIVPEKVTYKELLKTNYLSCLTVIYDREKVGKIYFNKNLKLHEDYAMWLKILKKIKKAYGNKEVLAVYRIRKNSSSRNKFKNLFKMIPIFYKEEKLGIFKTVYYLFEYGIRGLIKNKKILFR